MSIPSLWIDKPANVHERSIPSTASWKAVRDLLVCARCKGELRKLRELLLCRDCGTRWPVGASAPDFRVESPSPAFRDWRRFQSEFERESYEPRYALRDREGCREVYEELPIEMRGRFVDVGGADATVRHFLPPHVEYLCVDPYPEAPSLARRRGADPRFREVYPCLAEPYAFVCGLAEFLPLRSRQFDWVHMRSMIDHVLDPAAVIREGFRCLKPGGHLLLGLSVQGGAGKAVDPGLRGLAAQAARVLRYEGRKEFGVRVLRRLRGHRDHHLWHPSVDDLRSLLVNSGFTVLYEKWTSPPFDHVLYFLAQRPQ
jgi:SAM-dependent methyltransferase